MNVGLRVLSDIAGTTFVDYQVVFMPEMLPPGARPLTTRVFARTDEAARVIGEYVARTGPSGVYRSQPGKG